MPNRRQHYVCAAFIALALVSAGGAAYGAELPAPHHPRHLLRTCPPSGQSDCQRVYNSCNVFPPITGTACKTAFIECLYLCAAGAHK